MVQSKRRRHALEFKFRVAVEALKGDLTMAELSSRFELQSTQIQPVEEDASGRRGTGV